MSVTLVSTDPQEVVEKSLQRPVDTEPTFGEVADESAETAAESQTAQSESTEQHTSKRSQKIKRLAEKLQRAEARAEELEAKLKERESPRTEQRETAPDPFAYPKPKPKAADFDNPQDFVEALTDWKVEAAQYKYAKMAQQQQAHDSQAEIFESYNERVAEAHDKYDDFDEVVGNSKVKLWPEVQQALLVHPQGPDIVYYLANNPDKADELAEMAPLAAVAELGRIQFSNPPKPKPAPRMINPVGGGSMRPEVGDTSVLSHRQWKELRKAGKIR